MEEPGPVTQSWQMKTERSEVTGHTAKSGLRGAAGRGIITLVSAKREWSAGTHRRGATIATADHKLIRYCLHHKSGCHCMSHRGLN